MNLTPGEILDKASILKVKIRELRNGEKLAPQLADCFDALAAYPQSRVMFYFDELTRCNAAQWFSNERLFEMLDAKPVQAMNKDELFAAVACIQRAHAFNRRRVELKNEANAEFGSAAREEKSYANALAL
jgi:hypothetical protein